MNKYEGSNNASIQVRTCTLMQRGQNDIPENTHNKINFLNTLQEYLMCKTT